MNENENLVEQTENVEQTTEETPVIEEKKYTQAEVDAIIGKKKSRWETKIRKEYDRKYGELEDVLRAGTGKDSVDDMTDTFKNFYRSKGVKMPEKPKYTDREIEVLARAEANEFISEGFDAVVDEVDRLTEIGAAKMTDKEKALFRVLAEHRQNTERGNELAKIGVTEDVLNSSDFMEFQQMFAKNTPITKVYEMYAKTKPKKEHKTMGSMKQQSQNNAVKDYYSPEEISRLTEEDLDDPKVWDAVRRSMTRGR